MVSFLNRSVPLLTFILLCGCSRQDTAPQKQAKAEADASRADADASKAELARVKKELEAARAKEKVQKPNISEESRSRVVALFEKGGKLRASTDQGVAYNALKEQIADVKGAWETVTLVGWPAPWKAEQDKFEGAIEAWKLGQQIWETKLSLNTPYEKLIFSGNAYGEYGDKLKALSASIAKRTGDKSASEMLDKILKQSGDPPILPADQAIKWCFLAASQAFDKSREGLKDKLKQ